MPIARNDSYPTAMDTAVSSNLATNDTLSADGGNVWALGTQATHGTAVVNADGTFTYTPASGYTGLDAFTYQITDANGDVSTATVTLVIPGVWTLRHPGVYVCMAHTFCLLVGCIVSGDQFNFGTSTGAGDGGAG